MVRKTQDTAHRLREKLEEDPRTADYAIEVANESGVVTLEGKVPSAEVKTVAQSLAENTDGVISVTNALIVDENMDDEAAEGAMFPPYVPGSQ